MKLGVRGKLFAISLLLVVGVVVAAGFVVEPALRHRLEVRSERELLRHARAVRDIVQTAPHVDTLESADEVADRSGAAIEARVSIVSESGRVLGDSDLGLDELRALDSHGDRPEVLAARAEGQGIRRRFSSTLGEDMIYVALPYRRADGVGVVRVATPLAEVDEAIRDLRLALLFAALVAVGVAVLMSALASHMASRTLRALTESARAVARGERKGRLEVRFDDELGRIAGSFNVLAEELDRAVSKLADERARLETILDGMSEAVIALDGKNRVTLANAAALDLLGLETAPLNKALIRVLRVPALGDLLASLGESDSGSAEFELPGPPARRVLTHARAQLASGGTILVMLDVTETRRLEAIRRDFVANVSHELRTPVSVIRANAETLLDGPPEDPEKARKFLAAILRNAVRLSRLVTDLLDLSRIESGQVDLDLRRTAVEPALRRVVDAVEGEARAKQLTVKVEPTSAAVRADERALDQVLQNLVDNAVKYSEAGGHITVRAREEGERVHLEVQDDGPGIEARHRERVFERFYRVDAGRSREVGGTGLGLSIVKHLTEAMGGRVVVEGAEPRGSVFRVTLPLPPPQLPDEVTES